MLGAGSWGTAFAKVLVDAGNDVTLWARRERARRRDQRRAPQRRLPARHRPAGERCVATHDAAAALRGADLVAFAMPSQSLRENLRRAGSPTCPPDATLVSLMKGVELGTTKRMSEVIAEVAGAPAERIAVVSGPNLALRDRRRSSRPRPSSPASTRPRADAVQKLCSTPYFRPYTNTDVIGCELGGAVKNVIALACGIAQGMGFGDNTLASIITRGLAETARLGERLGADPLTFAGLAGLGDLVATCNSPLSRNRTLRRAARPRRVARPGAGGHPRPGRRGREVVPRRCSSWPAHTGSTSRSPRPSRRCASAA